MHALLLCGVPTHRCMHADLLTSSQRRSDSYCRSTADCLQIARLGELCLQALQPWHLEIRPACTAASSPLIPACERESSGTAHNLLQVTSAHGTVWIRETLHGVGIWSTSNQWPRGLGDRHRGSALAMQACTELRPSDVSKTLFAAADDHKHWHVRAYDRRAACRLFRRAPVMRRELRNEAVDTCRSQVATLLANKLDER